MVGVQEVIHIKKIIQKFKKKFRNGWSNMATINFEKSNELVDSDENWY